MTGKGRRIQPDAGGMGLHNVGDASIGQPFRLYALTFGNRSEHRPFADGGGFEPRLEGGHGAGDRPAWHRDHVPVPFLVGLAAVDSDAESLGRFLNVLVEVQFDQLGAAEGTGKADEQQGAVPNGRKPRPRERRRGGGGSLAGAPLAGRTRSSPLISPCL
jgi:hypothetical protein